MSDTGNKMTRAQLVEALTNDGVSCSTKMSVLRWRLFVFVPPFLLTKARTEERAYRAVATHSEDSYDNDGTSSLTFAQERAQEGPA
jgi:hypothetical protein